MQHSALRYPPHPAFLLRRLRLLLAGISFLLASGSALCLAEPPARTLFHHLTHTRIVSSQLQQLLPAIALCPAPASTFPRAAMLPDHLHLWVGYSMAVLAMLFARSVVRPSGSRRLLHTSIVASLLALCLGCLSLTTPSAGSLWLFSCLLSIATIVPSLLCLHYLQLLHRLHSNTHASASRRPTNRAPQPSGVRP